MPCDLGWPRFGHSLLGGNPKLSSASTPASPESRSMRPTPSVGARSRIVSPSAGVWLAVPCCPVHSRTSAAGRCPRAIPSSCMIPVFSWDRVCGSTVRGFKSYTTLVVALPPDSFLSGFDHSRSCFSMAVAQVAESMAFKVVLFITPHSHCRQPQRGQIASRSQRPIWPSYESASRY